MNDMLNLYVKSMGKIFKVLHIAKTDEDANEFCRKNRDTGVIATDNDLIFIASFYSAICKSSKIIDK